MSARPLVHGRYLTGGARGPFSGPLRADPPNVPLAHVWYLSQIPTLPSEFACALSPTTIALFLVLEANKLLCSLAEAHQLLSGTGSLSPEPSGPIPSLANHHMLSFTHSTNTPGGASPCQAELQSGSDQADLSSGTSA